MSRKIVIVAITKHGVEISRQLKTQLSEADLFYPAKFQIGDEKSNKIELFDRKLKQLLPELFRDYQGIVMFVALGAVVRLIAPLIIDKKTDPAIVVVDEQGKHVISVLSGHIGGGNLLTSEVARILGAVPVITTASDTQNTIQVDMLGKELNWYIEPIENAKMISAAVVNAEKVAIVQESGEKSWLEAFKKLPENIYFCTSLQEAKELAPKALLLITHRLLPINECCCKQTIFYRPKVIVIGIGCNRGTNMLEIEEVIKETLSELNFSINSVKAICSIDLKKDEQGLLEVADKYEWETNFYQAKELNTIKLQKPSITVYKYTGAYGVSEPAALLYSGADMLQVVKKKSGNVTISVALMNTKR